MRAELLAPAGSYESMTAAVAAGADAVYIGGSRFGARAYADNLTEERLIEALDFCHLYGVKLYLTVNTLLKEQELSELYDFLAPLYEHGLDAVIVQDLGALSYLRRQFPKLDLHASTQMTNQGADGAAYLESLGVKRVVTSRELSLKEIREIHKRTNLEIESFVHGALCYCYSGQCLMSSLIGGRSGNRGRCAQPCRLPYEFSKKSRETGSYLLSPKDICTLSILPDILEAGVCSLKIEGRMKRPEYTAGVVRIYRKYLDLYEKKGKKGYRVDPADIEELKDLYNRGGFSKGYYQTKGSAEMMSTFRQNHFGTEGARILSVRKNLMTAKAMEELHKGDVLESATLSSDVKKGAVFQLKTARGMTGKTGEILHRTSNAELLKELSEYQSFGFLKVKINGKLRISMGKPAILSLYYKDFEVTSSGQAAERARSVALTEEEISRQMKKTGNTPFIFEKLEVELEEGCFLPVQALKELRRNGLSMLMEKILQSDRREPAGKQSPRVLPEQNQTDQPAVSALAFSFEQAEALLSVRGIFRIYLESRLFLENPDKAEKLLAAILERGVQGYIAMPFIFREDVKAQYEQEPFRRLLKQADGYLIRNLETMVFLKENGFTQNWIADAGLYTYNQEGRYFLKQAGFLEDTAPLELNVSELKERRMEGSELIVYGRTPVMVSAQCLKRTTGNCDRRKEWNFLTDRKGMKFPVYNDCDSCTNLIFNSAPTFLYQNEKEIRRLLPKSLRLSFTVESGKEAGLTAEKFCGKFCFGKEEEFSLPEFTRGHFKRGVE